MRAPKTDARLVAEYTWEYRQIRSELERSPEARRRLLARVLRQLGVEPQRGSAEART